MNRLFVPLALLFTSACESPPPAPTRNEAPASEPAHVLSCMANEDYPCILRELGDGRAQTAQGLGFLAQAQRETAGDASACSTVETLFQRFPESDQAGRWRRFATTHCE